ncbi:arylmalonate decarboxylase [Pseudooceanicola sediminis]|uniref:Arylmalonate decarboxylase n=1 Tax=Pseudooceanicola sediminis TaxID=2211117 RepID=A0A399IY28_9RHOB|nr:arylmalonate decarboxylase [Pseudooceanicola sediminis]RII37880.1 arylmalonate decarboxylase [Pseudooceanicola sediminis]|tara:strand:- start:41714 stop:42460 length:747 start_codon:yes stop_codon:yes gene_type:complete
MTDSLGYRMKFGVIAPSTNTSVQPEFDDMRPVGVTNHFSRIVIPDDPVHSDEDFNELVMRIRAETMNAIDAVKTCSPDAMIMGMSAETFWDGKDRADSLKAEVEARAGMNVAMGSDACQNALKCFGDVKRIAVVTPYMPIGDEQVRKFFTDCGYEVVTVKGLKCTSPMLIAHETEKTLRDAINEVNDPSVEAIVQAGTNLAMARVGGIAEFWLDKPVIAINTATYWHALRMNGIQDKVQGYGSLLSHY